MGDHLDSSVASSSDETFSDSESVAVDAFRRDAEEIVSVYPGSKDLQQNKIARRFAFAAFEARRSFKHEREGRWHFVFYLVFLLMTLLGAPAVAILSPDDFRSVVWDCVGLGCTVLLLVVTYGGYILDMTRGAWGTLSEFFRDIFELPAPLRGIRTTDNQNLAGFHVVFFGMGLVLALFAGACLWGVCHELVRHPLECPSSFTGSALYECIESRHNRADSYSLFVAFVFALSVLFMFIDAFIARTDTRHSETFDASASFAFSTIPMAFGVLVIGIYLGSTYVHLFFFKHLPHREAMLQMPVEFVSGALTFQMVLSNVLFVLIKLKLFPRTVVAATKSTALP